MRNLLLSAVILAFIAPMAIAAPDGEKGPRDGDRPHAHRHGGHLKAALSKLDLSDDQRAEIKDIVEASREEAKAYREANGETIKKLMGEMKAAREAKDKDAAEAVRAELKKRHEASPMHAAHQAILGVLTDDQRAKLAEMRKNHDHGPRGEGDKPRKRGEGKKRPGKEAPVEG